MTETPKTPLKIMEPVLNDGDIEHLSMEPLALSIPHAAALLDMSVSKLWELVGSGELDSIKISSSRRIVVADLRDFLDKCRAEQTPNTKPLMSSCDCHQTQTISS